MQNTSHSSDAIDLFELCSILWKRKLTIIAITSISIIFAAIYAFTAKEEWNSNAQIIPPKAVQLGSYLEMQRGYYRFAEVEEDFKIENVVDDAYKTMVVMLNETNNKFDYLFNSEYYKSLIIKEDDDLEKQKMLIEMVGDDLKVKETTSGQKDSYDIGFVAENPNDAQKTLLGYIENTNKLVLNKLFDDLLKKIDERILTLEYSASNLKLQAEQTRKNNVLSLKQALTVAKEAGIVEYAGQGPVTANTRIDLTNSTINDLFNSENLFLLGEKYLTAQLNALETSTVIYPVNYYKTLNNIKGLKQLYDLEPKGMAFEYTSKPSLPLLKDRPLKSLILIFGALLGMVFGCGLVLVQSVVNNRIKK